MFARGQCVNTPRMTRNRNLPRSAPVPNVALVSAILAKSRRYRRGLLVLGTFTLLIVCILWISPEWTEPAFRGKRLSEWIEFGATSEDETTQETTTALQSMGVKAIPC